VFLIQKFSAAGSHRSAFPISRRGPPIRALTAPGTMGHATLCLAATLPCARVDNATMSKRRRSERPCPSASASASPLCSHPAASCHLASRITPLPVTEADTKPVRSLVSPLPHLLREPLYRAERSAIVLLPLAPLLSLCAGHRSSPCSSPHPPCRFYHADA
jgi:hypothetical protein